MCDPIWQVTSRSCEMESQLYTLLYLLVTFTHELRRKTAGAGDSLHESELRVCSLVGYRTLRPQDTSAPDQGKVGTLRTQDNSDETQLHW